ncbi:MAG: electron transporter RnfE [Betaproteobacteria bacterium RIFCSPHIGHO2_12_FULL_69_13]|nr:MAG: electron transporter RnfE [Betaproteobacteria bacterium RIFCSPHIGHO2_12_FULL_69_13]OGA68440.1 MAG: electron transporter RnfE [Betaproteobacteria bacterium RIFCSPLOWO2_12_FULL_68_20]
MWGDMGWGAGWGLFGGVGMLLWWALLILGIAVLVKWLIGGSSRAAGPAGDRALEVLRERYARGEIDKDEFDKRKRDLAP